MTEPQPPDDGVMLRYANGTLPVAERAAVDAWLRDHPDWAPRVALHRSMGAAIREATTTSSAPPSTSFAALWSEVGADAAGDVVPLGPPTLPRRRLPWLIAAAGAVAAALVAVLVLVGPGADRQRTADSSPGQVATTDAAPTSVPLVVPTSPATSAPASTSTPGPNTASTSVSNATPTTAPGADTPAATAGQQALHDALAASEDAGSATATMGVLLNPTDAAVISAAGEAGEEPFGRLWGAAAIEFPDRWTIEITNALGPIDAYGGAGETQTWVGSAGPLLVQCGAGTDQLVEASAAACTLIPFGTSFLSPTGLFDVIEEATGVTAQPIDDGLGFERYSFTVTLAVGEAEPVPVTIDVDVADDGGVIEAVTAHAVYRPAPDGEQLEFWVFWEFDQYGVPVTIPTG